MKNKVFGKIVSWTITLAMLLTALPLGMVSVQADVAQVKPTVINENVNVALGKTVTAINAPLDIVTSWDAMVDGNETTPVYLYTNKDAEGNINADAEGNPIESSITVDLGSRYNVKRIEFTTAAYNGAKQLFEIVGSNDENFDVSDTLYAVGGFADVELNTDFVDNKLTLNLDASMDYRYIRIKRNAYSWIQINELAVYADEALVEISRNANVTANTTWAGYSPSAVVDGKNASNADGWQSDYSGVIENENYMWVNIDLGATYPVKRIEIESIFDGYANSGTDYSGRRGWAVYGSNIAPVNADLQTVEAHSSGMNFLKLDGYTQLAYTYGTIPSYNSGVDIEGKAYTLSDCDLHWNSGVYAGETGIISQSVSGDYRYITLHRGAVSLTHLGEVRVYTPAVQANSVRVQDKKVTVSFSGEMSAAGMDAQSIVLTDAEGNVLAQTDASADGCEYTFTAEELRPRSEYTVTVADGLTSASGIAVAGKTFEITTPSLAEVTNIRLLDKDGLETTLVPSTAHTISAALTSTLPEDKTVIGIVAEKDASGNLVNAYATALNMPKGYSTMLLSFTTGETVGTSLEVYIWDTETLKPYSLKATK